jgi:hypothetical protein
MSYSTIGIGSGEGEREGRRDDEGVGQRRGCIKSQPSLHNSSRGRGSRGIAIGMGWAEAWASPKREAEERLRAARELLEPERLGEERERKEEGSYSSERRGFLRKSRLTTEQGGKGMEQLCQSLKKTERQGQTDRQREGGRGRLSSKSFSGERGSATLRGPQH